MKKNEGKLASKRKKKRLYLRRKKQGYLNLEEGESTKMKKMQK